MWRNRLETTAGGRRAMVWAIPLPTIAIQLGWITAEVGRQPWIVYGVMKTKDAVSKTVPAGNILFSIVLFSVVYALLAFFWLYRPPQGGPPRAGGRPARRGARRAGRAARPRRRRDAMDLQTTWFLLVGVLLAGYTILDGFDLGVGTLHLFLAKDDRERRTSLNSIGPVWDGNEVWLLTGGGALFAAFPPVYATVFSGFYLALMLLLVALIVRAVSLEFRSKEASPRWRQGWDVAFAVSSALPALLFGVALGNVLRGVPLDADGEYAGTFFTLLNPFALVVGLGGLAMFVMQGACWLNLKTEGAMKARAGGRRLPRLDRLRRALGGRWTLQPRRGAAPLGGVPPSADVDRAGRLPRGPLRRPRSS